MAITLDQANIYTGAGVGQTNHTGTTTAAVASGAMIVILAHRFKSGGGGTYTGTGGGLTWTTVATASSGNILIALIAAFAPSGLVLGTTNFGVNGSVGSNDYTVVANSYLGVDTSGTVTAAVRATNTGSAGTAAWATGAIAATAGDGLIGGAGGDGTLRTSTAAGDNSERIDFNSATSSGSITLVDDLNADGSSDTAAGTWSGTLTHVAVGAAFIPSGGGAAAASLIWQPSMSSLYSR